MKGRHSEKEEVQIQGDGFGVRHIQYVLFFTAALFAYAMRTSFNVAIIAMISSEPPSETIPTYPEWDPMKNVMLSSFFWGYLSTQLIAGQLAERFGPKWFIAGTFIIGSFFAIMIPTFGATFGYKGIIACRVLQGMSQGFLFPCLHNLLGKWCPLTGRAKACGFSYAGTSIGTVISMPVVGLISNSKTLGWPVAFYVLGSCGIAWALVWMVVGSNSPSQNRFISPTEKMYIEDGLKSEDGEKKKGPTPWIAILRCLPFWAIVINDCGESWGYWTLLTKTPSFMQNILNFDLSSNSLLTALPYLAFWLFSTSMGYLADFMNVRKITTISTSRKVFNSIAMFIPAVALLVLSFSGSSDRAISVTLLVIAVGCSGATYCGYIVNHIDLTPNYAATLLGMTNTVSNFFSLLTPLYVDAVSQYTGYTENDKELWTVVFCTPAGFYVFVGLVFIFGGSGEVQAWNDPNYSKTTKTCRKKLHN